MLSVDRIAKSLSPLPLATLMLVAGAGQARGATSASREAGIEFFEQKIRPVLVAECYECHQAKKAKGGLRLDYRAGWQQGGDSGAVIVRGNPAESLLIAALHHRTEDLRMPDKAPKLDPAVIANFEKWVAMGAPDPRDEPPRDPDAKPAWADVFATRKTWWSLQPVKKPLVPTPKASAWSAHAVDRFLLEKMAAQGLASAADADPRAVIRRLSFALTGLPPTPSETANFVAAADRDVSVALSAHVDRLLGSPRFGEHWARHWMDLMRYAETHGSEGDSEIRGAWRYRDYLIRAFNADLPIDQLIQEHLAGDLLESPRFSAAGINESLLGIAQFRMVEHGFQPIDTLDDQVKTVDNQIDVITKAFQGLTVSCARCHDHKFDAVSQRDYYALFGIFSSCRPAQIPIDTPAVLMQSRPELETLHAQTKQVLIEAWRAEATTMNRRLDVASLEKMSAPGEPVAKAWADVLHAADTNPTSPLHLWARLASVPAAEFPAVWTTLTASLKQAALAARATSTDVRRAWDLAGTDNARWFKLGPGLAGPAAKPGEFAITRSGDRIFTRLAPGGVLTRRWSEKYGGVLTSPRFKIETDSISVRAFGGGGAMVRVIVDHYPLPADSIFPRATLTQEKPGWIRLDTAYRKGSFAYIEFATYGELTKPLGDKKKKDDYENHDGHSYFGVDQIVCHNGETVPPTETSALAAVLAMPAPNSTGELADGYRQVLSQAITAWEENRLTEPQCALLDFFVQCDVLPVSLSVVAKALPLVAEYRRLEAALPVPQRAPGIFETVAEDAPLLKRGDHLHPGEKVPRGYLQVIDPAPYQTSLSGRRELAKAIANPTNPLTARVLVNRVWHWLFGRGLVATVDNFGRLGDKPTHPELLDFLAARFVEQHWSIKDLIRFLVTTRTFRVSSTASSAARTNDPGNEWLSHARVRRNEAEAIRDTLLAVAGNLDDDMFGPPSEKSARRSVYLPVKRTKPDPFLQVFDAPQPFTTLGRRDATNVPAQSLALLNSPFVIEQAAAWTKVEVAAETTTPLARIERMFERALARPPSEEEREASLAYLAATAREYEIEPDAWLAHAPLWQDLAQSLFNLKEFIYVR